MPYTNQMTIAQWIQNLTNDSIGITQSINSAYTHVQKWNALYGGPTLAIISLNAMSLESLYHTLCIF
jgi:hypothetical protein